jgi:hypothetical protein
MLRPSFLSRRRSAKGIRSRNTTLRWATRFYHTAVSNISALPAWYTFIAPQPAGSGISAQTGHDYLRMRDVSDLHSGVYTCRVTTNEADDGYSLTATVHLDVFGKTVMLPAHIRTLVQVHRCTLSRIRGNTFRFRSTEKLNIFCAVRCMGILLRITTGSRVMFIRSK